ncbi:MAG: secretin N-terminal domain-containing protein, partial [Vicinamibacteria bacterium]
MMRPRTSLLAAGLWTLAALVPLGLMAAGGPMPAGEVSFEVQEGPFAQAALPAGEVGGAQEPGRATALTGIAVTEENGDVLVRLSGDGRLTASSVQIPDGAPPRLALDFTGVTAQTPPRVTVGKGLVQRIRVARFSATPLVTRVVLDLRGTFLYKVRPADDQQGLVVTIGNPEERARRDDEAVSRDFAPVAAAAPARAAAAPATPPAVATTAQTRPAAPARVVPEPRTPAPSPAPTPTTATPSPAPAPKTATAADAATPTPRVAAGQPTGSHTPRPEAATATAPAAVATPAAVRMAPDELANAACDTSVSTYPISMDFDGVDLKAILRTFSEVAGVNLVIDPDVDGTVNVKLKDVPWNQALAVVLRTNALACVPVGSIVRIAPRGTLTTEISEGSKLRQAQADAERNRLRETRVVQLSYAKAQDVAPLVEKAALTPSFGSFQVDEKTNIIILNDLPGALDAAQSLITRLDAAPTQVEIEARMVLTTTDFAKRLGVRIAAAGRATPELGNTLPLAFPNSVVGNGGTGPSPSSMPRDAIGLMLGAINGSINLDVALAALEREENVKIILRPRVVTQNNTKAVITRGEEIPYTTVAAPPAGGGDGVQILQPIPQVQFKNAALTLAVTPQITASDTVILDVDVDNGSPGNPQPNGNISINTQRVQTRVLVANGGTTIIGGISESID